MLRRNFRGYRENKSIGGGPPRYNAFFIADLRPARSLRFRAYPSKDVGVRDLYSVSPLPKIGDIPHAGSPCAIGWSGRGALTLATALQIIAS